MTAHNKLLSISNSLPRHGCSRPYTQCRTCASGECTCAIRAGHPHGSSWRLLQQGAWPSLEHSQLSRRMIRALALLGSCPWQAHSFLLLGCGMRSYSSDKAKAWHGHELSQNMHGTNLAQPLCYSVSLFCTCRSTSTSMWTRN